MRQIMAALGLGALLLAGCLPHNVRGGTGPDTAPVPAKTPDVPGLVSYLNDNAQRLQSLECRDVSIDARQGSQPIGLSGVMSCARPRNFRLQARVLGSPAVDMGSNDQEFWYWISKAEPPYLVHCAYQDLARGNVPLPFPFQPDWILETLGMAESNPNGKYELKVNPKTLELIEQTVSNQGQPVYKVTVFNRAPSGSGQPQVTAHLLQDANHKEICSAYVAEVQVDKGSGGVFPRRVTLVWPAEQVQMALKLDSVRVNGLVDRDRMAALFTRPQMPNVPTIDLARLPARPTGQVQRVRGSMR
jgi:hypothetical protein